MLHGSLCTRFCIVQMCERRMLAVMCDIYFSYAVYTVTFADFACGPIWAMAVCHFSPMFGIAQNYTERRSA